eukprot:SAG31_NODE_2355_length_5879_cov_6.732526_6_plen_118_part_00
MLTPLDGEPVFAEYYASEVLLRYVTHFIERPIEHLSLGEFCIFSVRAVTFSFLCKLFEKYGTLIERNSALSTPQTNQGTMLGGIVTRSGGTSRLERTQNREPSIAGKGLLSRFCANY